MGPNHGAALALCLAFSLSAMPLYASIDFPSECSEPTSDTCPTCCKNLRNLAPAGDPALVFRNVRHVDKCISACANHTFYGLSNRHVCGCFDDCTLVEVPPSPFAVVSGFVKACLDSCFDPEPTLHTCQCPLHSTCLAGRDSTFKCCCKAPFHKLQYSNGQMTCTNPNQWQVSGDYL